MALEGTFSDFGLADIFQLVGHQKKTGVLTVRGEGGRLVTVSFEKGMVVFADEFQRSETERLGNVLLRTRRLSQEQLARAMEVQSSTSRRLGHVLIEQGLISQPELRQALQLQVKESVYRLFRWQQGSYHFSPEPVTFDREMYLPVPAELILMEGVRMIDEWPILEKKIPNFQVVFERVAVAPAKAAARTGRPAKADIEELMAMVDDESEPAAAAGGAPDADGLGPRERALLALVDGERTVQDIIDVGQLGEFETCKVLYGLLSLGLIRPRPAVGAARAVAPAPPPARRAAAAAGAGAREYAILAAAALFVLGAFLFNPWGIVAQGFRARESRRAAAAIADAARLRRVRLALEVYYLEKQAYPPELAKLAESGLLRAGELRAADGSGFLYRAGERDYRLERGEAGR
ncbi:MAG TPA: DUF4388 domain-containing protein [Candidatus Methanoperedens sp.]|nr:DUF4388 domain-containing protein [Candidatus Methanoperedens sp.]